MNEFQHPLTQQLAGVLAILIFIGSGYLWFRRGRNRKKSCYADLRPWSRSWLDLGIVIWFVFIMLVGLMFTAEQIISLNPQLSVSRGPEDEVTWAALLFGMTIQFALVITLLGAKGYYRIRYFNRSSKPDVKSRPFQSGTGKLIRYMPLLWLTAAASAWLLRKFEVSSGEQETITMMVAIANPWKYLFCVVTAVVLAPVLEELFFRAILLRFFVGKMRFTFALVISSVLFSALHFNLDSMVPIFILGCLLGSVYRETGDIRASIWMHAFFNGFSVLLISFDKWMNSGF